MSEYFIDALQSSVYHHPQKGCKLVYFGYPRRVKTMVNRQFVYQTEWVAKAKCKTHNAILCYAEKMCFWEIGAHNGKIEKGYAIAQKHLKS